MSQAIILDAIRNAKWFAHVPPDAHEWLAQRGSVRKVAAGQILFLAEEKITHFYCVIDGRLRLFLTAANDHELTLEEAGPGRWLPAAVSPGQPVSPASCVCEKDAQLVSIPASAIHELGERWPALYRGLYQDLAERIPLTLSRMELLCVHPLSVRLAVYFLRLIDERGLRAGSDVQLDVDLGQAELGTRVSATRQRINGVMRAWARKGLAQIDGHRIRFNSRGHLATEAGRTGFDASGYLAGWRTFRSNRKSPSSS